MVWSGLARQRTGIYPLYDKLSYLSQPFLRGMLKTFFISYVLLIGPVVEEWVFRDILYSKQVQSKTPSFFFTQRIYRIVANGLIFGAFHLNLIHGWGNLPIFVVTTVAGIVFASLREKTGNVRASTAAHCMNNCCLMAWKFA